MALLEELSHDPKSRESFARDIRKAMKMLEIGRRISNMVWGCVSPETSSQNDDVRGIILRRSFSKGKLSPETSSGDRDVGDRASDIQHGVEERLA